jgi:hypothetical protein
MRNKALLRQGLIFLCTLEEGSGVCAAERIGGQGGEWW